MKKEESLLIDMEYIHTNIYIHTHTYVWWNACDEKVDIRINWGGGKSAEGESEFGEGLMGDGNKSEQV